MNNKTREELVKELEKRKKEFENILEKTDKLLQEARQVKKEFENMQIENNLQFFSKLKKSKDKEIFFIITDNNEKYIELKHALKELSKKYDIKEGKNLYFLPVYEFPSNIIESFKKFIIIKVIKNEKSLLNFDTEILYKS